MRYCENQINDTAKNGIDVIKVFVSFLVLSPFRLIGAITKRVVFLGEYTSKLITGMIIFNTVLIVSQLLNSLLISKHFVIFEGTVPLLAMIISLVMCIALSIVINKFRYPINLGKVKNTEVPESSKEEALEKINIIHPESNIKTMDDMEDLDSIIDDEDDDEEVSIDLEDITYDNGPVSFMSMTDEEFLNNYTDKEVKSMLKSPKIDIAPIVNTMNKLDPRAMLEKAKAAYSESVGFSDTDVEDCFSLEQKMVSLTECLNAHIDKEREKLGKLDEDTKEYREYMRSDIFKLVDMGMGSQEQKEYAERIMNKKLDKERAHKARVKEKVSNGTYSLEFYNKFIIDFRTGSVCRKDGKPIIGTDGITIDTEF